MQISFNTNLITSPISSVSFKKHPQLKLNSLNYDTVCFGNARKTQATSDIEDELINCANLLGIEGGGTKDEIIDSLVEKCTHFDNLGHGAEGQIFPIPNTNYVLKTYGNNDVMGNETIELEEIDKLTGIKYKKTNWEILERFHGADLSKAFRRTYNSQKEFALIASSLPQSAYDDFLDKTCKIHRLGYCYDNFGNNLIVDFENDEFHPFDVAQQGNLFAGSLYKMNIDKNNPNKFTFDPIECFMYTMCVLLGDSNYNNALLKTIRAIANDFDNFDLFDLKDINSKINNKNPDDFLKLTAMLTNIQEAKKSLAKEDLSKVEIKEILKDELEAINDFIDELYDPAKDCSKKSMEQLNAVIEAKASLEEADKELSLKSYVVNNPIGITKKEAYEEYFKVMEKKHNLLNSLKENTDRLKREHQIII